jgi:hypothetical protein
MAGGLMQLVAYGAQDVYLTGNPKVTFFQAVYKKHTNFAMENIEQTLNGTPGASGRVSVTVARNGDLVGEMYLEATVGTLTDDVRKPYFAESLVKDIELSIGGQRIDKHYQRWWRLWSELCLDDAKKVNWAKMTSAPNSATGDKVYLPLIFFFNRNPGLYLPLIALQYHEVRLDIDLSASYDTAEVSSLKVWANYVYLDTEERRRFAQKGHEYLIEQVQHTGNDTVSGASQKQVRLSYNHPVKELVWCYSNPAVSANVWNVSNVSTLSLDFAGSNVLPHHAGAAFLVDVASTATEDVAGTLSSFKLVLNGQDRFKEQGGKYFNQVQPYCHHSGVPITGVYSYSFALKPEEHQPTGTCNFSRIDNAQVAVTQRTNTLNLTQEMFAVNYNVLRIQSGMGGLAFSN